MKKIIAANITYGGFTYNTRLLVEYAHTGGYYFMKTNKRTHILSGEESAMDKIAKGKKVFYSNGYYFIKRMAIPTINTKGQKDWWYITNDGDSYTINKVSKYGRRIHAELSTEAQPYPVKATIKQVA